MAKLADQVSFRISAHIREFYEELARKERRKLSDMFRLALEDHAKQLSEKKQHHRK